MFTIGTWRSCQTLRAPLSRAIRLLAVPALPDRSRIVAGGLLISGEKTDEIPLPSNFFRRFFFFNDTATTEIYTLSLHDALPICAPLSRAIRLLAVPALPDRSRIVAGDLL